MDFAQRILELERLEHCRLGSEENVLGGNDAVIAE